MYLITGGAGLIGGQIVRALNAEGVEDIIVADDPNDATKARNLRYRRVAEHIGKSELRARIRKDDLPSLTAILHQGARADTLSADEAFLKDNNVTASVELLELALRRSTPFIYASSVAVHGNRAVTGNAQALNAYARTKLELDEHVRGVLPLASSTVVGLCYANVYGPGERHKGRMASMAFRLYRQIVETGVARLFAGTDGFAPGAQRRDFVYVEDVARICLALARGPVQRAIVDVGTGRSRTFNELAELLIDAVGTGRIEYIPLDPALEGRYQSAVDVELDGLRDLGVGVPSTQLEEGIVRAVAAWRREDRNDLSPIHDFASKLTQPAAIEHLRSYVSWERARRAGEPTEAPEVGPLSINLDLTTSCNYRCDHCVDLPILNTGIRHDHDCLQASLTTMVERGLKSVILIGGGEPTLHPRFSATVRHAKELGLQLGIVTNGSRLERVLEVADLLAERDWVRLSLDAGADATFQAMHRPRKPIALEEICAGVPALKHANSAVQIGYSFIVVWQGSEANGAAIHENVGEMVAAARLAKAHGFDYISFKPFLERSEDNNAELVGRACEGDVIAQIHRHLDEARELADDSFSVVESTNLKVFLNGTHRDFTYQPAQCHMTFFRQVLSPLGVFNCPVYRNVRAARIGDKDAYDTPEAGQATVSDTLSVIQSFDASQRCRQVTCLYNRANWYIEELIEEPDILSHLGTGDDRLDLFL